MRASVPFQEVSPPRLAIAIAGKAGAGKTSLAEAIVEEIGAVRLSFGSWLKEELRRRVGLGKEDVGGREALIALGAEVRALDPYVLCRALEDRLWRFEGRPIVIDDLRCKPEFDWCRRNGYLTVRVEAPRMVRVRRLLDLGLDPEIADSEDPTECALDDEPCFDAVVVNLDGTCLRCEARRIVDLRLAA